MPGKCEVNTRFQASLVDVFASGCAKRATFSHLPWRERKCQGVPGSARVLLHYVAQTISASAQESRAVPACCHEVFDACGLAWHTGARALCHDLIVST